MPTHPVETYLSELREIRSTGGGSAEISYYGALEALLNEVGRKLKPRVRCVHNLAVTNYRDFVFVGRDEKDKPVKLETYHLADTENAFWAATAHPRKTAQEKGDRLVEFLRRVMMLPKLLSGEIRVKDANSFVRRVV
jgi:hypothetical protein